MSRIARYADLPAVPWRNGGGETREVAVSPAGAGFADFDWRISMATVARDGPFSEFPGIDRTLAIISGTGLHLEVRGLPAVDLTPDSPPHAFPADAPTSARLLAGPVLDLNVMTRRSSTHHRLSIWQPGMPAAADADHVALVCARGAIANAADRLHPGDVAFAPPAWIAAATAVGPAPLGFLIEIWRH